MKNSSKKLLSLALALAIVLSCLACAAYAIVIPQDVKNVILMIGDGMGENSLEWTKAQTGEPLFLDTLPYQGYSKTDSLSGTTDSAAGGTALSCGYHCFNSNLCTLSINIKGNGATVCDFFNLTQAAQAIGKKTGIVTSDDNSGATPASFSAHTYKRELAAEITEQQINSGVDLLWAHDNGIIDSAKVEKAGFAFATTMSEIDAVPEGSRSFAAIKGNIFADTGSEADAPLSILTEKAIARLDNDKGFFLMVEGAHIDKFSHANNEKNMAMALTEFDKAVETAVEFAKDDGNTIVIVTADHETGGITLNPETKEYEYTTGDHTGTDVPLRLFGSDELVKDGAAVENIQVARFAAKKLGYTGRFPSFSYNFAFPLDLIKALFKAIAA